MKKSIIWFIAVVLALSTLSCSLFTLASKSDGLRFSPDTLPKGQVGQEYQQVITLSNQRTPAFAMGAKGDSLPPGLTGTFDQDKQTYTLAGAPTQSGTYTLQVSAQCYGTNVSGQSGGIEYTLVIESRR
ncbi:MAG TPA: hypothetical protein VGJ97_05940 [Anaerolineaceae bacterium]|jgi:hypothetical protein